MWPSAANSSQLLASMWTFSFIETETTPLLRHCSSKLKYREMLGDSPSLSYFSRDTPVSLLMAPIAVDAGSRGSTTMNLG